MHNRLARNLLLKLAPKLPAYYVSTSSGNDTTGDGSFLTPWATLSKALATVPAAGKLRILMDAGTYSENTGATGYLNITQAFTDWIYIQPWHSGDAVTITNASGTTWSTRFQNGKNLHFINVTFEQTGATTKNTIEFTGTTLNQARFTDCAITTITFCASVTTTAVSVLQFNGCTMKKKTGAAGTVLLGFYAIVNTGGSLDVEFNNCTMTVESNSVTAAGIDISRFPSTSTHVVTTINGGTFTNTGGYAVQVDGGTATISGATFHTTGAGTPALVLGQDGTSTVTTTGSVTNCTVTSDTSHALLLGGGCNVVTASNLIVNAGDYGIVLKECQNTTVTGTTVNGGSLASVYFKAAVDSSFISGTINASGGQALLLTVNSVTLNKCSGCDFTDNTVICTSAADVFDWGDAADDDGGGICDRNSYDISGTSGNLGSVYGTAGIANLAALQAAWSTYGVTTNDANSTVTS